MSEVSHTNGYMECYCGRAAVIRTSKTSANPGRKFHGRLKYEKGGCNFFSWVDDPVAEFTKDIIPGLIRKSNALEEENIQLKGEKKKLKKENEKLHDENKKLKVDYKTLQTNNSRRLLKIYILITIVSFLWWFYSKSNGGEEAEANGLFKMIN